MRVAAPETEGGNSKLSGWCERKNYSPHLHDALFFNTQIATLLSACRGAWQTHGIKRPKIIAREEKAS
jgi:hypothetical protein